jgi:hypothetical protein
MSPRAAHPGVFQRADELLRAAATVVAKQGESGGFWQFFDSAPDDESHQADFERERLNRAAARQVMAARVNAGFIGLLGFCCFELQPPRLYAEVFDTRDPSQTPGTARSIVLTMPVKKTWTGKYRAATQGQLGGDAEPLQP